MKVHESETFPFAPEHLTEFRKELNKAGSFVNLMKQKKAIIEKDNEDRIARYDDIEGYKAKFLTGAYASLESFYDTEIPYTFWSALYEVLEKREADSQ